MSGGITSKEYFTHLTPEQRTAIEQKRMAGIKRAKAERDEARNEAQHLAPMLQTISEVERPPEEVLKKIRSIVDSGLRLELLRKKFFGDIKEKAWANLLHHMFKDQVTSDEQIGLQAVAAMRKQLKLLGKRVKELKAQQTKKFSLPIFDRIKNEEDSMFKLEIELGKALVLYGLVNKQDKNKSGSVLININVPRPEKVIEVVNE